MVFVSMDLSLTIEESITYYKNFIEKIIPNMFVRILGINGNLYKNGKRKKTCIIGGKRYYLYIQRMVYNNNYYFDLFPLFLIPNSTTPAEDLLEFIDNKYVLAKRRFKTKIEALLDIIDIYNLTNFDLLYNSKTISIYRSKKKHSFLLRKNNKSNLNIKKFIYIIYLHLSAHTSFS